MFRTAALLSFAYLAVVYGQQAGTSTAEVHPPLTWEQCTSGGSCTTQSSSVVLDSNWRWTHVVGGYTNCYTGNEWNATVCPDGTTCAANCALDGADYEGEAVIFFFTCDLPMLKYFNRDLWYHHKRKCSDSQIRHCFYSDKCRLPCVPYGPRQRDRIPDVQPIEPRIHL